MKTKSFLMNVALAAFLLAVSSTRILAAAGDIVFKVDIGYSSQCVPAVGNDGTVYISGTYYNESVSDYDYC